MSKIKNKKNVDTPSSSPYQGEKCAAFTLIELVITISLVGILFAISAPVFSQFQSSSRLKSSVQIFETSFGEAFSSARSRPECFVVESAKDLAKFSLKSYARENCNNLSDELISRDFKLNPGVEFSRDFKIIFEPPFGDIDFLTLMEREEEKTKKEDLKIQLCNNECASFIFYKKSGLVTRLPNPAENGK